MSQELIAFLNHYRKKNKNFVNKINYYYSKSIHSNLETYIQKTSHSINVIYTFTPTVRSNKLNFEVNNEIFGIINCENLKNIYINLIRKERQLEMDIADFYFRFAYQRFYKYISRHIPYKQARKKENR